MVDTIKFSEFVNGGDLSNDVTTVGLGTGGNTRYNNPWTFLPPGTTGDRPAPSAAIYYRLRLNTDLSFYEYYDPNAGDWIELSGSGTGTVNPGLENDLAYYPLNGTAISPVPSQADSVLVTGPTSIPSLSTTLPVGITIPGATITSSTASLTFGSVANAPVAGIDLTNKTYVDSLFSSGVTSIIGTANQVIASNPTGVVTLSLPQDIATTSAVQFNSVQFNSNNSILDSNGNIMFAFNPITSSVNYFTVFNRGITTATGSGPALTTTGADADIPIGIQSKGLGIFRLASAATSNQFLFLSGTSYQHLVSFNFPNTATSTVVTFQDASGTVAYLSDVAGTVTSATGTANQVLVNGTSGSAQTGAITLTLPQSIATTSAVQFNTVQFNSNNGLLDSNGNILLAFSPQALAVNYITLFNGAIGVNPALVSTGSDTNINIGLQAKGTGQIRLNSASTTAPILFQTGTALQHVTAFNFANTAQSRTATFQDSNGTVAWLTDIPSVTPSALTKTDDTNVTLTLGGSPTVALLAATSLTLGWTGQLALTRGGTNASLTASNGGIVYSTASAMAILSGTATAQQLLLSGASTTPQWSTSTYPLTNAVNTLLYASSANVMAALATANSSVLVTSSTGVPSMSGALTNGQLIIGNTGATPTVATLTAGTGISITNGSGAITINSVGGGLTTASIAGTTQTAAINTRYIVANAGQTTITLPTAFAVGDTVIIKGLGAAGWILKAGTATTIQMGSVATSSAGTLTSANQYDTVSVCGLVANTTWSVDYALSTGLTVA